MVENRNNRDELLAAILQCSVDDLAAVDETAYDLEDIAGRALSFGEDLSLDDIIAEMCVDGLEDLQKMIDTKIADLHQKRQDAIDLDDKETAAMYKSEIDRLYKVNPEEDLAVTCAGAESYISIIAHADIYATYLREELETIERMVGLPVSGKDW